MSTDTRRDGDSPDSPSLAPPSLGRLGLAALVIGLLVRLAYAFVADTTLWFDHVFNDATAIGLLEGRGFTVSTELPYAPAIFRTPGYPAFLAGVYGALGHSVRVAYVVNALLDTASCWLLFRLAARRVGAAPARFVLLLAATYPFFVHAVGSLSPEALATFLSLVLLWSIERWPPEGGWKRVVLTGLLLGALGWIKPVFLPLPAILLVTEPMRGRAWRLSLARAVAVGALALVAITPWIARNYSEFQRPVLAGELGLVVWHGTYDFSDERDTMIRTAFTDAKSSANDPYENTRERFASPERELEESDRFLGLAFERMAKRPLRAYVLDPLRRIPRLWVSMSYALGPWWIGAGAAAASIGYLVLGAIGLRLLWARRRELAAWWMLPVQLTLVYAAIHVEARYTLPARASLLLLAGVAIHAGWERFRARGKASS